MSKRRLSSTSAVPQPRIADGYYPQRQQKPVDVFHRTFHSCVGLIQSTANTHTRTFRRTLAAIHHHCRQLEKCDDTALAEYAQNLRQQLHQQGLTIELTRKAFALIRETAGRTVNMRHFDSQLIGGWVMVHGRLAEMETGEGKTLTATLAAATAALAGIPVHIVTVNDYLVIRDAALMGPIYKALGLRVGAVTEQMDAAQRRTAYASNITYCTNKQLAFDYLRDRILLGDDHGRLRLQLERLHRKKSRTDRLFLQGLCFAIVDEADSVLVDEARTPLIISKESANPEETQTYAQAMKLAAALRSDKDFTLDPVGRQIHLTDVGSEQLTASVKTLGGIWSGIRQREELVCKALGALYVYQQDRHYLVQDGKVLIIDENTGRTMADRSWERGLHQMIEIKEKCKVSGQREHVARLTYQRFFRRYMCLAGMTGTAREVRRELWSVYGLLVVKVPTNKPSQRRQIGRHIFSNKAAKWIAVLDRIKKIQSQGRPVLVGTRSVAESEHVSTMLDKAGLPHQVLNARQDASEAEIVAQAGQKKCITIATNMAGRGTDIPLQKGVGERGGLHIIATEGNEAQRIDRQLYGRCGRQGDPGSYESLLSLDDDLLEQYRKSFLLRLLGHMLEQNFPFSQRLGLLTFALAQRTRERYHLRIRRDLMQMDEHIGRLLAFSGRLE